MMMKATITIKERTEEQKHLRGAKVADQCRDCITDLNEDFFLCLIFNEFFTSCDLYID